MPLNKPSRRLVIAGAAAFMLPLPGRALTPADAQTYVQQVVDVFFGILASSASQATILTRFEREFTGYTDVDVIARTVLGPPYRSLSARQKRDFSRAFGRYLARKYGRQMMQYGDAEITITRTRDIGRKGILVSTQVRKRGQSPFLLEWQVSDRSGQTKLINLVIEGISLLTTERDEIRNLLAARGGDVSALTAYLAAQ